MEEVLALIYIKIVITELQALIQTLNTRGNMICRIITEI